jgi:hypothetical protein
MLPMPSIGGFLYALSFPLARLSTNSLTAPHIPCVCIRCVHRLWCTLGIVYACGAIVGLGILHGSFPGVMILQMSLERATCIYKDDTF